VCLRLLEGPLAILDGFNVIVGGKHLVGITNERYRVTRRAIDTMARRRSKNNK
jgi:hypothetical protein